MVWNCIKLVCFVIFFVSCFDKRYNNDVDNITVDEIVSNWSKSVEERGEPFYLGGAYVENGLVYFCITNDTYKVRNDIFERCKSNKGIIIRRCKNSKEFLMQRIKVLDSLLLEKDFTDLKYYGHYLDEKKNKIVIMLGDISESNIALFKETVMNSSVLIFEKSDELIFE